MPPESEPQPGVTPDNVEEEKPPQEFELPQPAPVQQEGTKIAKKPEMVTEDEKNRLKENLNTELLKLLPLSRSYSAELDKKLHPSLKNNLEESGNWVAWLKNNTPNTEQANDIQYAIEQLQRWNAIFDGFAKQSTQPLAPELPLLPESPTPPEPAINETLQAEQEQEVEEVDNRVEVGLSKNQQRVQRAVEQAKQRSQEFIDENIANFLEMNTKRELGTASLWDKIDERWSKHCLEGESGRLREVIFQTERSIKNYESRFQRIKANIDRFAALAETSPKLRSRLTQMHNQLWPEMEDLSGLISMQKALLETYRSSLEKMSVGLGIKPIRKPAPTEAEVERKNEGQSANNNERTEAKEGQIAESGAWGSYDDYINDFDSRIDSLSGAVGPSAGILNKNLSRKSALEKFFAWFLGFEKTARPATQGAA